MNLSNISEGELFKNYQELSNVLDQPIKTGNAKKAQLKDWERYFRYEKKGHSFIITHIYDVPLPENKNKTKYITTIQKLILDKVVQFDKAGYMFISKSELMKELRMINQNYTYMKYKQLRLAMHMNISLEEVEDFYLTSDDLLKRNIEAALNSLRNQSLVHWSHAITIVKLKADIETNRHNEIKVRKEETTNEYNEEVVTFSASKPISNKVYKKATKEEIELILETEKQVQLKYNCDSINEIFKKGLANKFYKEVRDILFADQHIYWYFNSYEIVANEKYIYSKYEELLDLELNDLEREESMSELNNDIMFKIMTNAETRRNKAVSLDNDKKRELRLNKDYLSNNQKLTDTLINKNALPLRYNLDK
jgi:hypothetical protein